VIETLNDDSQVLLLFLAGELPEHERQAVEQRLATEPALAEELEKLQSTYDHIGARLQDADELTAVPLNVTATARSIGRMMRQRLAEPRPLVAVRKQPAKSHLRPWLIRSGIAAAILVAVGIWISRSGKFEPVKEMAVGPTTTVATHPASTSDDNIELFKDSFTPPNRDIADVLNPSGTPKDMSIQDDVSPFLLKVGTIQE
jgi:anti-sigma factor RsiW